jgi:Flp pilus assembly pilin Flp
MDSMLRFLQDEQGQDLTEYALLLAFVLAAIIGLANGLHDSIAGIANVNDSNLGAASAAIHAP